MHSILLTLTGLGLAGLSSGQVIQQIFPAAARDACITASSTENGTPVTVTKCGVLESTAASQSWSFSLDTRFPQGPQPFRLFGTNKCLDVVDGLDADGTKLQIWDCIDNSPSQRFDYHTWQWSGGNNKCIDLTDGKSNDGNQLQVWTCSGGDNQRWSFQASPVNKRWTNWVSLFVDDFDNSICLSAESNTDGAPVVLAGCRDFSQFPNGNRTWFYPTQTTGTFQTYEKTKCLDVKDGNKQDGGLLQVWSCVEGSGNQQFDEASGQIKVVGTNKCLDVQGGKKIVGARIELQECTSPISDNQAFKSTDVLV